MAERSVHGAARERGLPGPRIEVQPINEQPAGIPAPPRPDPSAGRQADGRFAAGNPWAVVAGVERARRAQYAAQLADSLGLHDVPAWLAPYLDAAREFVTAKVAWLASISGGELGPGPASMIQSSALALAASRAAYASGDVDRGAKLGAESSQRLSAAREMAVKDALARQGNGANANAYPLPAIRREP